MLLGWSRWADRLVGPSFHTLKQISLFAWIPLISVWFGLGDVAKVVGLCRPLAPHRNDRLKPLRMMIMGIPNVGKSTLMNALLKKKVAKVGDEPAVTKSQQALDLSPTASLIDTPGMMWPKIEFDSDGYMLAASHAIGRNAVIDEAVANFLGDVLLARYPALVAARYKIPVDGLDGQIGRASCRERVSSPV